MRNESETRLHGRWLFIARAGWVALTLLVLTLNAIAIPQANALLQAVCQPGALCANGWTLAEVSQIKQLGLSPGLPAAYQIGWDVGTTLIYTALAALIFWRRSTDRMALFCAYMLVLFGGATYTGLLDLGLRTVSPAWFWLVGGLALLYFGLIFALQLLFQGMFHQNNAVAIVISTLAIAALFQPLRHRLQKIIGNRQALWKATNSVPSEDEAREER